MGHTRVASWPGTRRQIRARESLVRPSLVHAMPRTSIVQFTLTAEVAYLASSTVPLEGVDTSFQSTSLLVGNIIAF